MTKKKDIVFLRVAYLRGPNIWTYRPIIEAWVDIGELENYPSNKIPGFFERLTAWLPALIEHRCGVGERGGFLQRLREGTWAAHILEHVALELQNLAGMRTGFGKARQTSEPGVYKLVFRTRQEEVGRAALAAGRDLVMAAIEDRPYDVAGCVARLRDLADSRCLGPSTAHIVDAAIERGIPFIRLNEGNLVQLGHGVHQRRIWTAETDKTSAIAESISRDKDLTKALLRSCGVPVPEGRLAESPEDAWEAAQNIGLPVAVKPCDGNHGRGVSLDLMTREDVEAAYHLASREGTGIMVEQSIAGSEHRLLVVGRRVVAAARGEPAWVTGDGKSNIGELIDSQLNVDPRRGEGEEFPLNVIDLEGSDEVLLELERQGMNPQSVPSAGQKVLVQRNGNVAFDVTDQVHPSVAAMAVLAARVVGLDIAGIDLVAEDISRPLDQQRGAVIEVNAGPGLLAHLKPADGPPRPVGAAIVNHLFSAGENGRIPIVGITGTRGTALIAHLLAWIMQFNGKYVGLACSEGVYLNKRQIVAAKDVDWEAGRRLLINRMVETAVFQNDSRMILSDGMPYDRCAIGIVTDAGGYEQLADFHINEPEQMHAVIRTQVDLVLPDGVAVLNANDPAVAELAPLCDGKVIFYSMDAQQEAIANQRELGERAVYLRANRIVLAAGAQEIGQLPLPVTDLVHESVLAAVAAAWAFGIAPEVISAGIQSFESNPSQIKLQA